MNSKYEQQFLDYASKLDAIAETHGELTTLASAIVENKEDEKIKELFGRISELTKDSDSPHLKEIKHISKAVKDSLMSYYGYLELKRICEKEDMPEDNRSMDQLQAELNELVGLKMVKEKVGELLAYQSVQVKRRQVGLNSEKTTMHMAFTGNPGTGKTTVARIIGRMYKKIGLLSKGQFIEVSRTDLIAGYQGQTAIKVKKVIENAKGGVLFIDEAYSITENDHSDSYGRECLTELTKALEDYREDLVVIVAGYTEPMEKFFESNPGLKSRFNTFIEFGDYNSSELLEILELMCKKNDYVLSKPLENRLSGVLGEICEDKEENFANARLVRNLFDDMTMMHAKRVDRIDNPTVEDLSTILNEDCTDSILDELRYQSVNSKTEGNE